MVRHGEAGHARLKCLHDLRDRRASPLNRRAAKPDCGQGPAWRLATGLLAQQSWALAVEKTASGTHADGLQSLW
jgi:hypothetical protein